MGLNFGHTCPTIDGGIGEVKDIIEDFLDDVICENNPAFYRANNGDDKNHLIKSLAQNLFNEIEYIFENVRETNSDMREAADHQITELGYEIGDLNEEIVQLKEDKEDLEIKIGELKNELEFMKRT
jgi:peptidoglycan hydrolase CwlO-like protein